jgi:hypothetical protein
LTTTPEQEFEDAVNTCKFDGNAKQSTKAFAVR